jgi:DNA (cytosine-5)-methyltransferase 1
VQRSSPEIAHHRFGSPVMSRPTLQVSAIDLFCAAGGLSHGLQQAGVVGGGIDVEPACRYPFEASIEAPVR